MAAGNSSVPFLDLTSFVREEMAASSSNPLASAAESPFVSVYEHAGGEPEYEDPLREAYAQLVNQLYDEEFDEALFEASSELRGLHQSHRASGYSAIDADRLVSRHFAKFTAEVETAVAALGQRFTQQNGLEASHEFEESEVDSFVQNYVPSAPVDPAFENLFGKILKKVGGALKKVGKAALKGVKALGWNLVIPRVQAIIKPFLMKVLQQAIGKLPEAVQPAAQRLARRFGFNVAATRPAMSPQTTVTDTDGTAISNAAVSNANAVVESGGVVAPGVITPDVGDVTGGAGTPNTPSPSVQEPAGDSPAKLQTELDLQIAEAVLAQDEAVMSHETAELLRAANVPARPIFSDLEEARERFVAELGNLREGESAEPLIQHFLPLLLPALKLGFRIGGRRTMVDLLSRLLAKFIASLIGPAQAPALSRAIVDAGLKLLNLEMSDEETSGLAPSAVAATVEETVSRVAALPDHVLDDRELLEGFVLEAFEQAAAANLPAVLAEHAYKDRPELLEAGVNAAWLMRPFRRPRYKRCSRGFKVRITPHMAQEIESFEDSPLSDYLQDQLGIPEGETIEAEVHLYEALPGTTIADIANGESEVGSLGAADEATLAQLHPLTHEAAARMLGRPALGRALPFGSHRRHLFAGQRLYHLAIPGRRPLSVLLHSGRHRVRRLAHLRVILDATQDQLRVCVYLSERKAQRLAVRLRQGAHSGSLAVWFSKFLTRRLGPILRGQRPRRLRIVHAGVAPGVAPASLLTKLPGAVPQVFVNKVAEWLLLAFNEFTKNQATQYLAAVDDPADGVTLNFSVERPHGLKELARALLENGSTATALSDSMTKTTQPNVRVEVFPGHKCG